MKTRFLTLMLLVASSIGIANAQFLQMGLKLGYTSSSIDAIYNDVSSEVQNFSTEFLQKCDLGLMVRLKFGGHIYLQPEANFSISSVWSNVDSANTFMERLGTAFDSLQSVNLAVPVLLGLKIIDIEDFLALRAFVGPEFYTSIKTAGDDARNFDFKEFVDNASLVAGAGVDLFNFIYVDGRVNYLVKEDKVFFRLGLGLLF